MPGEYKLSYDVTNLNSYAGNLYVSADSVGVQH
jgi:hypothetical protein